VTFSDSRVVDLVKSKLEAVWESVSPVKTATFDLGEGKSVRGVMSGEIAIYFCRPDGKVFDILPALHSPHVTYWAIRDALELYERTGATDEAIAQHHNVQLIGMALRGAGEPSPEALKSKKALSDRRNARDPGDRALGEMIYSKTIVVLPEALTVVEPGGLEMFKQKIHEALSSNPPRTPGEWKHHVFVEILDQELRGGDFTYDVNTLAPLALLDE